MFKTLLEELQQNMESEKHTINSFCQGMQEAIAKTHASMIMEVQRWVLIIKLQQQTSKNYVLRNTCSESGSRGFSVQIYVMEDFLLKFLFQ